MKFWYFSCGIGAKVLYLGSGGAGKFSESFSLVQFFLEDFSLFSAGGGARGKRNGGYSSANPSELQLPSLLNNI